MDRHKVWKIVPKTQNLQIMKSKWIYNLKDMSDSNIERYEDRLVTVGSSLRVGWDYIESFSSVIKLESFRVLMTIPSVKKMCIKQYDIRTTYLYANLDKAVYMKQPEGFVTRSKEDYLETEEDIMDELISKLRCKFDIKEIPGKLKFLNIRIEETVDGIYLSQEDYIDKIPNKFGLEECNPSRTPAACQQNLNEYEDSDSG
ncbi:hypothetical protein KM043_016467 [Ampulex compressa]|nr:hypothetical protein KM043_016467 [Ampulex compressa]